MAESDAVWDRLFEKLSQFKSRNGHTKVPKHYSEDMELATWVLEQRKDFKVYIMIKSDAEREKLFANENFALTPSRAKKLEELGFEMSNKNPRHIRWDFRFQQLKEFKEEYGHTQVPIGWDVNVKLANWVSTQRQEFKNLRKGRTSQLNEQRIELLNELGFAWEVQRGGRRRQLTSLASASKETKNDSGIVPGRALEGGGTDVDATARVKKSPIRKQQQKKAEQDSPEQTSIHENPNPNAWEHRAMAESQMAAQAMNAAAAAAATGPMWAAGLPPHQAHLMAYQQYAAMSALSPHAFFGPYAGIPPHLLHGASFGAQGGMLHPQHDATDVMPPANFLRGSDPPSDSPFGIPEGTTNHLHTVRTGNREMGGASNVGPNGAATKRQSSDPPADTPASAAKKQRRADRVKASKSKRTSANYSDATQCDEVPSSVIVKKEEGSPESTKYTETRFKNEERMVGRGFAMSKHSMLNGDEGLSAHDGRQSNEPPGEKRFSNCNEAHFEDAEEDNSL
ncbi:helicase [Seminavis robusta]|uniref:Helicase n=1 Tax=Seminavis robusta TaxID=568900 RepID=A0A9N8DX29_9STRA|nr:helicase [Seminavis robusta]|eukprot:Sro311_g114300.1 helicase (509) ;mRNA; r:38647-40828